MYIGKEFTKDEMLDRCDALSDGPEYSAQTVSDSFRTLESALGSIPQRLQPRRHLQGVHSFERFRIPII